MIRRLFVLGSMLFLLGLVCCQQVWGQCQPTNQPTTGIGKPQALAPADYANQTGRAAVTMNVDTSFSPVSYSHALTLGAGTNVWINYNARNSSSVSFYYSIDNGPRQIWGNQPPSSPTAIMNGTFSYDFGPWAGHIFHGYAVAQEKPGSGAFTTTTQDVITVTVTNQAPGIYYSDGNDSNVYVLIQSFYGGTPDIPYSTTCTQAAEKPMTPQAQLNVANTTSGENRNGVTMFGGTTVVGQPVNASAYDYISALPGDTIAGNYGGLTMCTAIGDIFGLQSLFRVEGAKVVVKDLGHPPHAGSDGSAIYDVAPLCDNESDPPDWQPKVVHSFVGRQTYWVGECQLLRAPDLNGVPWIPLCDVMTDASGAFGAGLIPTTIQLAAGGLSLPYPGPAPSLPIPGKCTKYPVNVLFTVGPNDLANFFRNIPN